MKRFFWAKYYTTAGSFDRRKDGSLRRDKHNSRLKTEAEFWKCMALMKVGSTIKIPRRQFLDEEEPWERPAVFIEIRPIRWDWLASRREYRCEPEISLHIVTDWAEGSDGHPGIGRMTDLPERIHERLAGLDGDGFYGLDLMESHTNHDHGEILEMVEMVEVYTCYGSRIFR